MRKLCFISLVVAFILMIGCAKTVYVPMETVRIEKEYVDRWQQDSIHLHDSIWVEKKGDTIWLEKYKTLYKEVIRRDSIFVVDSVRVDKPYPVVEIKEINRLYHWQTLLMCLGGVLIGLFVYRLWRWWKK